MFNYVLKIIIDEVVEWLPRCEEKVSDINVLRTWKTIGPVRNTALSAVKLILSCLVEKSTRRLLVQ